MPCSHGTHEVESRREMLARCANGFGGVALVALLGQRAWGQLVLPVGQTGESGLEIEPIAQPSVPMRRAQLPPRDRRHDQFPPA